MHLKMLLMFRLVFMSLDLLSAVFFGRKSAGQGPNVNYFFLNLRDFNTDR